MAICKYFQNGNCRFGNNCRFEHPGANAAGNVNRNRFSPLSGGTIRLGGGNVPEYVFSTTEVTNDLNEGKGRPNWLLSAWGVKEGPRSFFEDYSPEEVRWRFYELAAQGKEAEADQEAIALWNKADADMRQLASKVDQISELMVEGEKQHPNRWDFLKTDGTKTREQIIREAEALNKPSSNSGFGSNSNASNAFAKPATSTFGQPSQPSVFGATSSPFGKPAFGQSGFGTRSPSSAFGQPSSGNAFGKPAFGASGFGQAAQPSSTFGQPSQPTSTFGLPSQPSSGFGSSPSFGGPQQKNPFAAASASSGFGQPSSTFGQPSQPTSTFGQPSQSTSAFGQPSQPSSSFGQPSQPASNFGQPSQPTSTFGQPSQPSTFGQPGQPASAFGQPSQAASTFGQPSAFGQSPSTFGQPSQATSTSTFGQPSQTTSTFGQPSQTVSGFGKPAFGASAAPSFGQPASAVNPFGTTPATQQPNDQAMETTSPGASRPVSRENPFSRPAAAANQPAATSSAASAPQPQAMVKPILNTSSAPHPLTGKPPAGVIITQSLPTQPTQKNGRQVISYRGQRVQYIDREPCYQRPSGKGYQKIWFPDGGASEEVVMLNREDKLEDLQGADGQYTETIKEEYKFFYDTGVFKDGKIPLVPPLREWGVYDF